MAFPGLAGVGFQVLLLGLPFFESVDPVGFLFPEGREPGARVGGTVLGVPVPEGGATTVADDLAALVEPEREAEGADDGGQAEGCRGLWVLVRAEAGLLAWLVSLDSAWAPVGKDLEELATRDWALSGTGWGVTGFCCVGFTVGPKALIGAWRGVGGTSFWLGGADFVGERGAVFWIRCGLLVGVTEEERARGLVGRFLGILVAVTFCKGWATTGWALVGLAGKAGAKGRGALVDDSLANDDAVCAGPPPATCW